MRCENQIELLRKCRIIFIVLVIFHSCIFPVLGQAYVQQRCSNRLETALEHMRRRGSHIKSTRSLRLDLTPYSIYQEIYGQEKNDAGKGEQYDTGGAKYNREMRLFNSFDSSPGGGGSNFQRRRQLHQLPVSRVEVEDLKVRLPMNSAERWVEVDKCKFSTANATLETRLIFPDLTISGRVILHPTGGKCNMILRLRHAGIEFRTIPLGGIGTWSSGSAEEARRTGSASVRTDSHFSEPGFISVFAHGCQGPSGIKLRQNSKRRFGFVNSATQQQTPLSPSGLELSDVFVGTRDNIINNDRGGKYYNPHQPEYDIRSANVQHLMSQQDRDQMLHRDREQQEPLNNYYRSRLRYRRQTSSGNDQTYNHEDMMTFNDDILNIDDNLQDFLQTDAREFAEIFRANNNELSELTAKKTAAGNADPSNIGEALTRELEKLFSMGVRGLLTTYMQRALQPAIKETLMENMGYTLSYG